MKQLIKPLSALVALACLSGMAQADQRPNWNRVGLLYQEQGFEGGTLYGQGLAGTKQVGRNGLLHGSFSTLSISETFACESAAGCVTENLEADWLTLGVGARQPLASNTDFFAILSYEEQDLTESEENSQGDTLLKKSGRGTGFGVRAGVRSMVTEVIELTAALRYLNIEDEDETGYEFGGQYLITDQFSLGLDFSSTSGDRMTGISAYYHF